MTFGYRPGLGTTAMSGFRFPDADKEVLDERLLKEMKRVFVADGGPRPHCLPRDPARPDRIQARRSDELRLGDVVLFDYQIVHRGGANPSKDHRALIYATYARSWYGDSNFVLPYHANAVNFVNGRGWRGLTPNGKKDFARIARSARFAMPTHEWDAAVRASSPNPVSLPSDEPLFPYDPSEVYEKDATEVETDALYYLT
mmetsp:Transcript_29576/g.91451  ORF Transcript_29576/g.91451 Transcript_29576/m.91451 type:complete len:200 (-) Transcript_29576:99-698(-)